MPFVKKKHLILLAFIAGTIGLPWNLVFASLTGNLFDQIRADEDQGGYWLRAHLSIALPFKMKSGSGVGDYLEIALAKPTVDGGILNELPFEDTRFPGMEFNVPIREISFNQYDRLNPRIILRFSKRFHYAYNVTQNGRMLSILIKSSPITDENLNPSVSSGLAKAPSQPLQDSADLGFDGSLPPKAPPGKTPPPASAKGLAGKNTKKPPPAQTAKNEPAPQPNPSPETVSEVSTDLEKSMKLITAHKYTQAIGILQKLQSNGANSPLAKESLEMLGVAYERAGQERSAQAIYEQYIEKYPNTDDGARVRQRLLMLNSSAVMKTSLTAPLSTGNPSFSREAFGSLSQYYMHGLENKNEQSLTKTDESRVQTLFDLSTRTRSDAFDFKGAFNGSFLHDFRREKPEHLDVNTLYADTQYKLARIGMRAGRQSSPPGSGILGKFDGVSAFYQYSSRSRLLVATGYPLDYMHKDSVQTDKPLTAISVGLGNWWNAVEVTPFYMRQMDHSLEERNATGAEARIGVGPFASFVVVDYDINFKDFNMISLNGTLNATQDLTLIGMIDYRRPDLSSFNAALINSAAFGLQKCHAATDNPINSVADLQRLGCSEEDLRQRVKELAGSTTTVAGGITYMPTSEHQFNFDASIAEYVLKSSINTLAETETSVERQGNVTTTYTRNKLWNERSSIYAGTTTNYSSQIASFNLYTGAHYVWRNNLHIYTRLAYEHLWQHQAQLLQDFIRPMLRMEYQDTKRSTEYQLDLSTEHQTTITGDTTGAFADGSRFQITAGYRWIF